MPTTCTHRSVFETITKEHGDLELLFDRVAKAVARGVDDTPGLNAMFDGLIRRLERHFANEETGGYFTEIVDLAPRLATAARRLEREHGTLLVNARHLHGCLPFAQKSDRAWSTFQCEFAAFARQYSRHETAENRLVQETYLQDIGALD